MNEMLQGYNSFSLLFICGGVFVVAALLFLYLFKEEKIAFSTVFLGFYLIFVAPCFFLMTLHLNGIIDVWQISGINYESRYALPLGDGNIQLTYIIGVLTSLFLGIYSGRLIILNKEKNISTHLQSVKETDNYLDIYFWLAVIIFVSCLLYKIVRWYLFLDLPLYLFMEQNITPAAASLMNSVRKDMSYLFLPSIDFQVFRILMPLSVLMISYVWYETRNRAVLIVLLFSFVCIIFFSFAHLKRTPLLNVGLWFVIFAVIMKRLEYKMVLFSGFLLIIFAFVGMNSVHYLGNKSVTNESVVTEIVINGAEVSGNESSYVKYICSRVFTRIVFGESIGNYYAVGYWGDASGYLGSKFIKNYLNRVAGGTKMTIAEEWYSILSGRDYYGGSESLSIFLEMYVFYGLIPSFVTAFLCGLSLAMLDWIRFLYGKKYYRPVFAGLVLTVSTMALKGFWSPFFTGGTLILIIMLLIVRLTRYNDNPIGKVIFLVVRRLPSVST